MITVLAANRLRYFGCCSLKLFVLSESPGEFGGMSTVCSGKTSRKMLDFKGGQNSPGTFPFCSDGGDSCIF